MGTDLAKELRAIVEQVTDPIAALEDVKLRLRGLIRGMDNFMQAAQDVTSAAEQSDYSKVATLNATKRWESKIGKVYADFKFVNEQLQEIVGKGLRRHSGKGKSLTQRKAKGGKDYSGIDAETLKKQTAGIVQDLAKGIQQVADDGAFLLQQIDRITGYKNPSEKTVEEEMAALWQDFIDFRDSFGAKVWAPLTGILKRLDAVSAPLTKFGPAVGREMDTKPEPKATGLAAAWGDWAAMEAVGCLNDKQRQVIAESMQRDQRRSVGKFGLTEAKEKEEPGFEGEPSAGGADKMAAKGYKFKILLKKGPPLYAKTEKGAKEVQADYPGSKIVANEAIDGEITDASLIAEAGSRTLASVLPDFDALLEDGFDPSSIIGEAAELVAEAAPYGDNPDKWFSLLEKALKGMVLPASEDGFQTRKAEADEFMLMQADEKKAQFKHRKSRNYLYLDAQGKITIPKGGSFQKGAFPESVEDGRRPFDQGSDLTEEGIGQTIIQQMGGLNRISAMLGAQVMWLPKGVGIKWPNKQPSKGNYVEIILTPDDLYDMTFYNIRNMGKKPVKSYTGLYSDALVDTFEGQTGWYLRL